MQGGGIFREIFFRPRCIVIACIISAEFTRRFFVLGRGLRFPDFIVFAELTSARAMEWVCNGRMARIFVAGIFGWFKKKMSI